MASTKGRVLSLYRQILRLSKTWESLSGKESETRKEKDYIRMEAQDLFKKNKRVTDEAEIEGFIKEAETRIELALHYRIPYPRPMNIPQHTLPPGKKQLKAQKRSLDQAQPIYLKSYKDRKDES